MVLHERDVLVEVSAWSVDHVCPDHLVQLWILLLVGNLSTDDQANVFGPDLCHWSDPQEDVGMRKTMLLVLNGVQEGSHLPKAPFFSSFLFFWRKTRAMMSGRS